MRQLGGVRPSHEAEGMARFMLSATDVQHLILIETVESAEAGQTRESGRTVCPSGEEQIRGPLGRFPRAVELQSCPVGMAGIMHTHVSIDELRRPHHSLPDMSNVVFSDVAASIVVGTQEIDVMLSPDDPEAAIVEFQDALGLDVESAHDVVDAIVDGQIPDPAEARGRARSRLSGIIRREPAFFSDLDVRVGALADTGAIPATQPILASCHAHSHTPVAVQPEDEEVDEWYHHSEITETTRRMRARRKANEVAVRNVARTAVRTDPVGIAIQAAVGQWARNLVT